MRKTPILLLAICCILCTASMATSISTSLDRPSPYFISAEDFLSLTPAKYQDLTGKKLSFFQRIALRMQQQKIKRLLKKKEPAMLSDFEPTGFVLGLFISVVGVGMSYLINYKETRKWAWIGAGIGAIFILIAVLL